MTDKSLKEIFVGAREMLSDPAKWNRSGSYYNPRLGCFCVFGACGAAAGIPLEDLSPKSQPFWAMRQKVAPALRRCLPDEVGGSVVVFNDSVASHADMLALFDCAIKCCDEPAS